MTEAHEPRSFRDLLTFAFPVLMDRSRISIFGTLASVLLLVLWVSPVSPFALARADAALGEGRPTLAADRYDAVARWNPIPSMREDALLRAAIVWAVDLRSPSEARRRLERIVAERPGDERLASAYEQIAHVLLHDERRPSEAADVYARAGDIRPTSGRATRTALALSEAGREDEALERWQQVAEVWPELLPRALLAEGEILLRRGDVEGALDRYGRAERIAPDLDQQTLARLGVATCLERLGNLDEALAAIDQANLPDDVRDTRLERIRARREGSRP